MLAHNLFGTSACDGCATTTFVDLNYHNGIDYNVLAKYRSVAKIFAPRRNGDKISQRMLHAAAELCSFPLGVL